MSLLRHDARRDANEPEIVEALEKVGCLVMRLGLIDLLVCLRGELFLLEVKTLRGTRTKTQAKLLAEGWPISTVTNISEALAAISTQSRSFRRCKTCDHTFEVGQGGYSENREFCNGIDWMQTHHTTQARSECYALSEQRASAHWSSYTASHAPTVVIKRHRAAVLIATWTLFTGKTSSSRVRSKKRTSTY